MRRLRRPRRARQAGQALVAALLVVLLTATAASLVAADLALRQRAMLEEAERVRARTLLDAALADALARLAASGGFPGRRGEEGGGAFASEVERLAPLRYEVRVEARYRGRRQAARAEVTRSALGAVSVHAWQRVPAPPSGAE